MGGDNDRGRGDVPLIAPGHDADRQTLGQAPSSDESHIMQSGSVDGSLSLVDHLGALTYYRGGVKPQNCAEVRRAGYPESGRYRVYPAQSHGPVFVDCDMANLDGRMAVRHLLIQI